MFLAFLNLGPSELALILILLLVFFGADKVPELARSLGRAKAELDKAQKEVSTALKSQDERQLEEQLAFERMREAHIRAQGDAERIPLARAAEELGVKAEGLSNEELRKAIADRVAGGADAGQKDS